MDNEEVAADIFEYMRRATERIVESIIAKFNEEDLPLEPAEGINNVNNNSELHGFSSTLTLKRRRSLTPPRKSNKKLKSKNCSRTNSSLHLPDYTGVVCKWRPGACIRCTRGSVSQNFDYSKDMGLQLNDAFSNFLWILEWLQFNPLRTNDQMIKIITMLCKGLCEIVKLSHLHLTDRQYLRVSRIRETLFAVIKNCKEGNPPMQMVTRIHVEIESVFVNFLDQLSHENLNVELQIYRYGFISGLIVSITDIEIRKLLVEKLLLRIRSTIQTMYIACAFCKNSQAMDPDVINLFYFYCQLLEATVTLADWKTETTWLTDTVLQNLLTLVEAAGSLFARLPNISYIFYPVIVAARQMGQRVQLE